MAAGGSISPNSTTSGFSGEPHGSQRGTPRSSAASLARASASVTRAPHRGTAGARDAPVHLDQLAGARPAVEHVDVLGDHRVHQPRGLERRERAMDVVWLLVLERREALP